MICETEKRVWIHGEETEERGERVSQPTRYRYEKKKHSMKGILLKVEEQSSWVSFMGESEPKNIISKGHFETILKLWPRTNPVKKTIRRRNLKVSNYL